MKRLMIKSVSIFILISMIVLPIGHASVGNEKVKTIETISSNEAEAVLGLLDISEAFDIIGIDRMEIDTDSGAELRKDNVYLPYNGKIFLDIKVPKHGEYCFAFDYKPEKETVLKNTLLVNINDIEMNISASPYWKDVSTEFEQDRYGNEIAPMQEMLDLVSREYFYESTRVDTNPIIYQLEEGITRMEIINIGEPIMISSLYLVKPPTYFDYTDYEVENNNKEDQAADGVWVMEAETYLAKSDTFITLDNDQNPALVPYDTKKKLLNIIEPGSWQDGGQKVVWAFNINEPGFYNLAFKYHQPLVEGMPVFRNIEIDGKTPFKELRSYPFKYTGLKWRNEILSDDQDEPYRIWLDQGIHTLALEADSTKLAYTIDELMRIMYEINDTGMSIKKLTGNNLDRNRTWDIVQYIPDIIEQLEDWANQLETEYSRIVEITGENNPSYVVNMKLAAENLRRIAMKPERIPYKLEEFSEGSDSIAQLIGDLAPRLAQQPLGLDRIYIFKGDKLPEANKDLLSGLVQGVKNFFLSFTTNNSNYSVRGNMDEDELQVWVNRPIQYVETLQQLIDSGFSRDTGIKVRLSIMPNEEKLILSNASGSSPDVALGISNWIPFEMGIRGALVDFREFDDFFPYIKEDYNLETLVPFTINDKIFGVTETQDFFVLFYRKDILEKLGIPIPQTWDDIKEILPELQRYSMNFYMPLCTSDMKYFYATAPFIYQSGGSLYNEDGTRTTIDTEESIKGLELMTELFSIYSLPEKVENFYNSFRYGTTPIGIADFDTYVTLINAAPEIAGLWDIAPAPGIMNDTGEIVRYQVGGDSADVIFDSSSRKDDCWEFLKWWLSKDTQVQYAYTLETRFGPTYMWNTANLNAFKESSFKGEHKKVIEEQWEWIKDIPWHPGGYMLEREISNVWNSVVLEGQNLRVAVDRASITVNRELERKLTEFGYIKEGKLVKPYIIPSIVDIKMWGE